MSKNQVKVNTAYGEVTRKKINRNFQNCHFRDPFMALVQKKWADATDTYEALKHMSLECGLCDEETFNKIYEDKLHIAKEEPEQVPAMVEVAKVVPAQAVADSTKPKTAVTDFVTAFIAAGNSKTQAHEALKTAGWAQDVLSIEFPELYKTAIPAPVPVVTPIPSPQ